MFNPFDRFVAVSEAEINGDDNIGLNLDNVVAKQPNYRGNGPEAIFLKEVSTRLYELKLIKTSQEIEKETHRIRPAVPQLIDYINDTKRSETDHESMIALYEENWASQRDLYTGEDLSYEDANGKATNEAYDENPELDKLDNYELLMHAFDTYAEINNVDDNPKDIKAHFQS